MVDIASSLGVGSGIDTTALVRDLVNASRQPRQEAINGRVSVNNARISALASAKGSLSTFSNALNELLKGNGYKGQPASNDLTIAAVSISGTGTPSGLPAQLDVRQLASAQTLQSVSLAASTTAAGTGSLTLTTGSGSFNIALTAPSNSLADLAAAINASESGVTASVATDTSGARLILKGATGADQAFTLAANPDADTDLARFTWNGTTGGMSRSQTAQNAIIRIDNVEMTFASNTVTTAIPNLRIDLNKAAPGTLVTLAMNQPSATMKQLVEEYVGAYNQLRTALNSASAPGTAGSQGGPLAGDAGIRDMGRRLSALTSTVLSPDGPYTTLADLGVSTNRDGTLKLDSARLDKAIAENPAAVTEMLNPAEPSETRPGLAGALKSVTDYLNSADGPLATSSNAYDKLKTALQKQLDALDSSMSSYEERLTQTYTAMQTRLTALKATQSYLEQQVKVWTNSN